MVSTSSHNWRSIDAVKSSPVIPEDLFERTVSYIRHFQSAFALDDWNRVNKKYFGNKSNLFGFSDDEFRNFAKGVFDDLPFLSSNWRDIEKVFLEVAELESLHSVQLFRPLIDQVGYEDLSVRRTAKAHQDQLVAQSIESKSVTQGKSDIVDIGSQMDWSYQQKTSDLVEILESSILSHHKRVDDQITLQSLVGKKVFMVEADAFVAETSYFLLSRLIEVFDSLRVGDFINTGVLSDAIADTTLNEYLLNETLLNGALSTSFSISPFIQRIGFPEEGVDPVGVTDEISRSNEFVRRYGESLGVTDTALIATSWHRYYQDHWVVDDLVEMDINKPAGDPITVSDYLHKQLGVNLSSSFAMDDWVGADVPDLYKRVQADKTNITTITDQFARRVGWSRAFLDKPNINDITTLSVLHPVTGDLLGVADDVDVVLIRNTSMLNSFSLNEVVLNQ